MGGGCLFIVNKSFWSIFKNPLLLRETVRQNEGVGVMLFILLYILQILFAPLPGQVLTVSSGMLFGTIKGIMVCWLSIIIGGFLAMALSRFFGKKLVKFFLDDKARKFEEKITRKGIPVLILLSIFPNPIGDGIFYLAGLTSVPLKVLIILFSLGRLPGIVISVYIGDKIITYGMKGLIVAGMGFIIAIICYLIFRRKFERLFEHAMEKILKTKEAT